MVKGLYRIWDESYGLAITKEGLKNTYPASPHPKEINKYEIMAEECKLPADNTMNDIHGFYRQNNDTIVRNVETGTIIFTQRRFLRKIEESCPTCGKKY